MLFLANGFAARGYSVDLVLANAEGPYLDDVVHEVRIVDLDSTGVARSLPGLVRYLRRERPAVLLSAMKHANVVAILAGEVARAGTKIVISEHSNVTMAVGNETSRRGRSLGGLMRWMYPRAKRRIAVSGGVAEDMAVRLDLPRSSIDVVHNPVVTQRLLARAEEPVAHVWFKAGGLPVILAVGRLEAPKNFPMLVRAFARLRRTHDVRLVILGEGSLRDELEGEVSRLGLTDMVDLPGFVDNPYSFMRASSLFVLSSAWEGFGNVLVEAMACGTPVVSTDCPSGPAEILENGRWGRLVPVNDEAALADAMAATLVDHDHPDVATRSEAFSVDRAIDGYLHVMISSHAG